MAEPVIETKGLTKLYGEKTGCMDVSISVSSGEIFGFLGPNGAGKSTFVKMMTGLLFPTSGNAAILNRPLGDVQARACMGYLPENFRYHEWMTGAELLSFHASLYKMGKKESRIRIGEVLELVKLKGQENYKIGAYSKGMQQRIGLAAALLHDPMLLVLDEPTSALDPIGRIEVREMLQELKKKGKTIFLNSHLLSEVETLCDSIAFINKGVILKQGKIDEILNAVILLDIRADHINDALLAKLGNFDRNTVYDGNTINMSIKRKDEIPEIVAAIVENGGKLYELIPHGENLEKLFISLVGGGENR